MASTPIIDVESLLQPIPGENPEGANPRPIRQQIDSLLSERQDPKNPWINEDGQQRPNMIPPDFRKVAEIAVEALKNQSKDLGIAQRLTLAWLEIHSIRGLRDALLLLTRMMDDCWDRVHPALETLPEDLELRAAPFLWISNPNQRPYFPNKVKLAPLLPGKQIKNSGDSPLYSADDIKKVLDDPEGDDFRNYKQAQANCKKDYCQNLYEDIESTLENLTALEAVLAQRLDGLPVSEMPNMAELRSAIENCRDAVKPTYLLKFPSSAIEMVAVESATDSGVGSGEVANLAQPHKGGVLTRQMIYDQIRQAAKALKILEPHSPVPYLIERAASLGDMPFPVMIRELVREEKVLDDMKRELGLTGESQHESND